MNAIRKTITLYIKIKHADLIKREYIISHEYNLHDCIYKSSISFIQTYMCIYIENILYPLCRITAPINVSEV